MSRFPGSGPSGIAAEPHAGLASLPLPIRDLATTTVLHRVHRTHHSPIFFGPGAGKAPTYRFDSATGRFGVLYAGLSLDAALIETLLRQPSRLTIDPSDVLTRSASRLEASRPLRLVDLDGPGLSRLGIDGAIFTGPYGPTWRWSDALRGHADEPDGILYPSRHDPRELCVALFERPDLSLLARASTPLERQPQDLARVLDVHGKSLAGPL